MFGSPFQRQVLSPNTDIVIDSDGYVNSTTITRLSTTQFQLDPGVYEIKAYANRTEFQTPFSALDVLNIYIYNHTAAGNLTSFPVIQGFPIITTVGIQKSGCQSNTIIFDAPTTIVIGLRAVDVVGNLVAVIFPSLVIQRIG